ncbi:MAG: N-acetylmuramidase [Spirochaetaceae bacterium]|nr:N-acetylmuramidase [Spirochaetaceae bacterium]
MDGFESAFQKTFEHEGGYSNNKADRGGETNYGITKKLFEDAIAHGVISGITDIKDLTPDQARDIYRAYFWKPLRLDEILNQDIASEIFDTGVNSGPGRATLIAQLALDYLGEDVKTDGVMGPTTIGLINKWCNKDPRALFISLNGFQFINFVAIVEESLIEEITRRVKSDDSQHIFSRGWTKRIQDYRQA